MLYLDNKSSALLGGFESRGPFQAVFVLFVAYLLFCAFYVCLKKQKVYFSNVLKSVIAISIVFLVNAVFFDKNDHYSILSCMYSFAWSILIFAMDNIFMHFDDNKIQKFSLMMGFVFLYTVFNAIQTFFYMASAYDRLLIPSIYISLMFLPWILTVDKKFYKVEMKYVFLFIMVVITLVSVKRGAILALTVALIVYFYKESKIKKGKSSIVKIAFVIVFLGMSLYIVDSLLGGSITSRFSADNIKDGSGRGDSNSFAIDMILNSDSAIELIIGFSTRSLIEGEFLGHNDWLSFLLKYGILGTVCFASMFYRLFKNSFVARYYVLSPCYSVLVVVMLMQSFYSTTYNPTIHPIIAMMYIGFAESRIRRYKLGIESYE